MKYFVVFNAALGVTQVMRAAEVIAINSTTFLMGCRATFDVLAQADTETDANRMEALLLDERMQRKKSA